MKPKTFRLIIATLVSSLAMWIIAGLWHNLVLPTINKNMEAHHEGIGIMLVAYFVLAFLMSLLYIMISFKNTKPIFKGLTLGIIVGVLWVLPHGLTMAGVHNTSIVYEIKNTLWHIVEQGTGGIVISLFFRNHR